MCVDQNKSTHTGPEIYVLRIRGVHMEHMYPSTTISVPVTFYPSIRGTCRHAVVGVKERLNFPSF